MADEIDSRRGDRRTAFVAVVLAAATLAVYAHACVNEFVNYDDPQYVTDNVHVRDGLSAAGVRWAFTSTEVCNWHPLTWLSLQLDHQLFGLRPWGYHLTNILLHTANTLLLFGVLCHLTRAVWCSAVVAGLFALHPLHVESVAWVAERKDVLSTFFGLLALAAYLGYVQRPSLLRYLPVFAALGLSLMAKPMLVTLPALLLLLDYWPLGRLRLGSQTVPASNPAGAASPAPLALVVGEKLPLFALAAGASVLTVIAQYGSGAVVPLDAIPLGQRAGNAVVSYVRYLRMAVWPVGLAPFYPYPRAVLPAWQVGGAAVLLVGVTALVLMSARRRPYLLVGWLWYLGTLVPVIGLVQVGRQALADRYTYVPLVGLGLMAVWGLADLRARRAGLRSLLVAVAAAVLLACAVQTWLQVRVWHDSRALWEHTLRVTTDNYLAEANLGGACLIGKGTLTEAEEHLRAAVQIKPDYAWAWGRLGVALDKQGNLEEATACYSRSLELDPNQSRTHNNLAVALARQGDLEGAVAHLQEAARLEPDSAEFQRNLAMALARLGRLDEAIAAWRRCVGVEPYNARHHEALAALLRQRGADEEAAIHWREAQRLRGRYFP